MQKKRVIYVRYETKKLFFKAVPTYGNKHLGDCNAKLVDACCLSSINLFIASLAFCHFSDE